MWVHDVARARHRGAAPARRLVACGELPVGRADLPARQPAAARAAAPRARQAAPARALGDDARAELRLRAHEPRDPPREPGRDLRHRPRARRAGRGRERLPRGHLHRGLPARRSRRGGPAPALPPVLLPRRHPQPRRAGDARVRSTRAASSATRSCTRYGAAFDNPDLLVCCVVGDGEAETGPLAASWHSNKFLNPARDGAVLPILHLNGYKIANPTVLARIPRRELRALLEGYGYAPRFVDGRRPGGDAPADGGDARRGGRGDRRDPSAPRARMRRRARSARAGR